MRLLGLLFIAPIFSSNMFLVRYKMILALWLSLAVAPGLLESIEVPNNILWFGFILLKELIIGGILGFFISLIFMILRVSAELFSIQIGLGFSQMFDPIRQAEVSLVGNFFYLISVLLFISIGGLHYSLKIVVQSYKLLPLINYSDHVDLIHHTVWYYFINMFRLAMQFALPIVAVSILLTIILAIVGKVAPQSNILILGLPLQYSLGILMMFLLMPFILELFREVILDNMRDINDFVRKLSMGAQ